MRSYRSFDGGVTRVGTLSGGELVIRGRGKGNCVVVPPDAQINDVLRNAPPTASPEFILAAAAALHGRAHFVVESEATAPRIASDSASA